jgi:hypothetical protein
MGCCFKRQLLNGMETPPSEPGPQRIVAIDSDNDTACQDHQEMSQFTKCRTHGIELKYNLTCVNVHSLQRMRSDPPMASPAKTTLQKTRENISAIQQALSDMEYLCSGTLIKRTKLCGNPRCDCKVDPAARHGPYYEWGFLQAGTLRHRMLSPKRAALMRLAIANHRKVKKLLKAWEAQTVRLIELNVPE